MQDHYENNKVREEDFLIWYMTKMDDRWNIYLLISIAMIFSNPYGIIFRSIQCKQFWTDFVVWSDSSSAILVFWPLRTKWCYINVKQYWQVSWNSTWNNHMQTNFKLFSILHFILKITFNLQIRFSASECVFKRSVILFSCFCYNANTNILKHCVTLNGFPIWAKINVFFKQGFNFSTVKIVFIYCRHLDKIH